MLSICAAFSEITYLKKLGPQIMLTNFVECIHLLLSEKKSFEAFLTINPVSKLRNKKDPRDSGNPCVNNIATPANILVTVPDCLQGFTAAHWTQLHVSVPLFIESQPDALALKLCGNSLRPCCESGWIVSSRTYLAGTNAAPLTTKLMDVVWQEVSTINGITGQCSKKPHVS